MPPKAKTQKPKNFSGKQKFKNNSKQRNDGENHTSPESFSALSIQPRDVHSPPVTQHLETSDSSTLDRHLSSSGYKMKILTGFYSLDSPMYPAGIVVEYGINLPAFIELVSCCYQVIAVNLNSTQIHAFTRPLFYRYCCGLLMNRISDISYKAGYSTEHTRYGEIHFIPRPIYLYLSAIGRINAPDGKIYQPIFNKEVIRKMVNYFSECYDDQSFHQTHGVNSVPTGSSAASLVKMCNYISGYNEEYDADKLSDHIKGSSELYDDVKPDPDHIKIISEVEFTFHENSIKFERVNLPSDALNSKICNDLLQAITETSSSLSDCRSIGFFKTVDVEPDFATNFAFTSVLSSLNAKYSGSMNIPEYETGSIGVLAQRFSDGDSSIIVSPFRLSDTQCGLAYATPVINPLDAESLARGFETSKIRIKPNEVLGSWVVKSLQK